MNKKILVVVTIAILLISVLVGCGQSSQLDTKLGNLDYESVDVNTITDNYLISWYQENYKEEGVYSFDTDEYKYILLAAGEKPTGGYSIEITSIEGTEESIVVNGKVNVPEKDEMVITAITYPNVLVRIESDSRPVSLGDFDNKRAQLDNNQKDVKEGKGIYVGQIDNNSIEIEVEGKPTAFRLSENVSVKIQESEPQTGVEVEFLYEENEHGQLVITELLWTKAEKEGTYVGQIDNNSVEIEINGKATAYRLSEEVKASIEDLNSGAKVKFTYFKNKNGQLVITSIKKAE
jgi:hypothetical protein